MCNKAEVKYLYMQIEINAERLLYVKMQNQFRKWISAWREKYACYGMQVEQAKRANIYL